MNAPLDRNWVVSEIVATAAALRSQQKEIISQALASNEIARLIIERSELLLQASRRLLGFLDGRHESDRDKEASAP